MNKINAAERKKVAAQYEGDAERILIVEKAKAEAESKRLQGQGIADQRREIARGLEESVDVLNNVGINSQEASALIVVTQHYDTLQSIGEETGSNLILLPNSPQAGSEMLNNMVASFTASNQIGEAMKAQKIALARSTDRSFETLESLERMIISQGEQTTRVQEVLSVVLEKLALEPRQNINMRDSVLTQENHSTPSMTEDILSLLG